jgi:selenocysteine lyase/cysteine desulfurase
LADASRAQASAATLRAAMPPLDDWDVVRDQFELSTDYIHLGGLLLASHPAPVREAIERHRRGLDANPVHYLREQGPRSEAAVLLAAARYLGASPADIALTDSTTMGLGLLYGGLRLREGQEVLTTTHDYYATHESLGLAAARSGATVRRVSLYQRLETVSEDEIVETVAAAVSPRTRVMAITWVHSSTGLKLPVSRLAQTLAEINAAREPAERALLCVDGVHGLGVEDATVQDPSTGSPNAQLPRGSESARRTGQGLGCDFFVAGCHKWLLGPRGTGLVWGRPDAWEAAAPTIPSFTFNGTPGSAMTPGGFHSFEHRWALAEAFEFHQQIGKSAVAARIHELSSQLKEGLSAMRHIELYTPLSESLSAGLVCFDVVGMRPTAVVRRLRQRGIIATVSPYTTSYARLATSLFNTPDEIDVALQEIRALA